MSQSGWILRDWIRKIGIFFSYLSEMERGLRFPRPSTRKKIEYYLKV